MDGRAAAELLTGWYAAHARDLPWRRTQDPWAILLSEVLLQQTRVDVGRRAYPKLLQTFATPAALARASEQEVLQAWAGLGYYRRARNLHAAAKALVRGHGGRVPRDAAALAALPGVGPYTIAAVRAFAFDEPAAPLDANVARVLARLTGDDGDVASPRTRARLEATCLDLVRHGRPSVVAQAIMELGALVCTSEEARCGACPLTAHCAAFRDGRQQELPVKKRKTPPVRERWAFARVVRDGAVLLEQRGPGLLEGFWALPGARLDRGVLATEALQARLGQLGIPALVGAPEARGRWVFSHRRWDFGVHPGQVQGRAEPLPGARWVPLAEVADLPVAQPHRAHLAPRTTATRAKKPRRL